MLGVASRCSSRRFADVAVCTGVVVNASTGVVVYNAVDVNFLDLVFRLNKLLPECASRVDGCRNPDLTEGANERFRSARVIRQGDVAFTLIPYRRLIYRVCVLCLCVVFFVHSTLLNQFRMSNYLCIPNMVTIDKSFPRFFNLLALLSSYLEKVLQLQQQQRQ